MSTDIQPTGQPTVPTEPDDRSIVAWFNAEGVVSRVLMRVDDYARLSGADSRLPHYRSRQLGEFLDFARFHARTHQHR